MSCNKNKLWLFNDGGDGGGEYWLVWMEWHPAGWSLCPPLLIFPCTIESRSSLLAPAHLGGPGEREVKRLRWLFDDGQTDQTLQYNLLITEW